MITFKDWGWLWQPWRWKPHLLKTANNSLALVCFILSCSSEIYIFYFCVFGLQKWNIYVDAICTSAKTRRFLSVAVRLIKHRLVPGRASSFSWLGGPEVTHPIGLREVPASIPGSCKGFYVSFFMFCCFVFLLFPKYIICHDILRIFLQC